MPSSWSVNFWNKVIFICRVIVASTTGLSDLVACSAVSGASLVSVTALVVLYHKYQEMSAPWFSK